MRLPGILAIAALVCFSQPGFADPTQPAAGGPAGVFGEASAAAEVNPLTGALTRLIELDLPRARGLAQPRLSVSYSSTARDRELGYGWALDVPSIERRPLSGWPKYIDDGKPQNEDSYAYGDQLLLYICTGSITSCGDPGAPLPSWARDEGWRYYRPQVEGMYARFFLSRDRRTWRIQYKGGVILELGAPHFAPGLGEAAIESAANGVPFRWRPVRQFDLHNNVIVYTWRAIGNRGLLYLTDIRDTAPANGSLELSTF